LQRWNDMTVQQRVWLVGAALATLAVAGGMLWLSMKPDWRVLYAGLDPRDEQQVSAQLTQAGIKYDVTPDGATVRVLADQLDKARLQVAAKGMPQSGRMGFELFDKPNWSGSEFDEQVNYQRALEGELEHTISSLGEVSSARVHLVLPKEGLFASEKQEAKASVVLQLRRTTLSEDEIESIRNLVAGAVAGLRPEQVTLVDAAGHVNLGPKNANAIAASEEQTLSDKLVEVLEPLAGQDNVRATVSVQYDDSTDEQTDEVYDPTQTVATSVQRSEQTMTPRGAVGGIPGTASNAGAGSAAGVTSVGTAKPPATPTPTAGAAAAAATATNPAAVGTAGVPVYPQANGQLESDREESSTYAVTRHLHHSEQAPGRLDRITAAVVVNDRSVMEGTGANMHQVWKPRTPEEMQRLTQLAQAAVGFDSQRGDQVVVENLSFSSNVPPPPMTKTQQIIEQTTTLLNNNPTAVRMVLGALGVLLLIFAVLRPTAKKITAVLTAGPPQQLAFAEAETAGLVEPEAAPLPEVKQSRLSSLVSDAHKGQAQVLFEQVTSRISKEPAQSVKLLESWINANDTGME